MKFQLSNCFSNNVYNILIIFKIVIILFHTPRRIDFENSESFIANDNDNDDFETWDKLLFRNESLRPT